ncbi:MAG: TonB family protein [Brevundimonas sp.]|uniref:TonB family protein n=1 Tax=Brevundimonas sp. TaxID=1871086 RepID=UPI0026256005|nr:TonB family protein [Brevundimonas sp.]MDI6623713.1 TonB family protein [Brevundimonas sp.]MDQ7812088.1 TonB family protein [Brevundimonas sp.]
MATGGPETSGGRPGRGLDAAVWALVIAALIGLAAAIAWYLSNAAFTFPEIAFEDDSVDLEVLIPVAPAPEPPAGDLPPSGEPAATRDPDLPGVTLPKWTRLPAPLFPALAQSRGIERGEVQLVCEALASGELGACEVLRESPSGAGFAEAALDAARDARVEPYSIDGFRTDSRIAYTVHFRMAPEP